MYSTVDKPGLVVLQLTTRNKVDTVKVIEVTLPSSSVEMQRIGHFSQQSIDMETNPIEKDMREELVSEVLSNFIVRLCHLLSWLLEDRRVYTFASFGETKVKNKTKYLGNGGTLHSWTSLARQTKEWYNISKRTIYMEPQ